MGKRVYGLDVVAALLICLTACRNSEDKPVMVSVDSALPVPPPTPAGREAASNCPHTGLWAVCSVERRLKQSGFVAKKLDEAPARAGFSVKPLVYSLGRSRLEIFLYENASELSKDIAALDTVLVAPRGVTTSPWESAPTLIRSGNLAAVLLTSSPLQAERLSLALTAGAPQPGSPR
ncbi:MAG: hypothetical protein ABI556_00990 [Gemmatimonadales bacterium]